MSLRPIDYLHDPRLNKGTSFTATEREALGLRGLLPPRVLTQQDQPGCAAATQRHRERAAGPDVRATYPSYV